MYIGGVTMKPNNQTINYQDPFLAYLVSNKISVTVFLVNGVQIRGKVLQSDNFTIALESEGKQQLVFKHAISTIVPAKSVPVKDLQYK
jgi:host factor-I protein